MGVLHAMSAHRIRTAKQQEVDHVHHCPTVLMGRQGKQESNAPSARQGMDYLEENARSAVQGNTVMEQLHAKSAPMMDTQAHQANPHVLPFRTATMV